MPDLQNLLNIVFYMIKYPDRLSTRNEYQIQTEQISYSLNMLT
jgi:hypothetical protein